jgi:hypothetical protein
LQMAGFLEAWPWLSEGRLKALLTFNFHNGHTHTHTHTHTRTHPELFPVKNSKESFQNTFQLCPAPEISAALFHSRGAWVLLLQSVSCLLTCHPLLALPHSGNLIFTMLSPVTGPLCMLFHHTLKVCFLLYFLKFQTCFQINWLFL